MIRNKLRNGGKKRYKAFLGADGAIMAAATLAAASITTGATLAAAKSQSKAIVDSAKTQAQSIKDQTLNNNNLQREQLAFTRQQNQENRQQQQDIQTTLQLMAGQQNMNDRIERNKMQVKYGGNKKRSIKFQPFYGGAPFRVTDGGGVIPLAINQDGYGLYELYGNDHEHYHKTRGDKNKTGVGIKFNDGSVVEGEGNQNTNQGELLYVTPEDAIFISKHSIDGFNPAQAVNQGVHPIEAFNVQEYLKAINGLKDDGSKAKCGKHKSIKRLMGGNNPIINQANLTQSYTNNTAPISAGIIYGINTTSPVEKIQTMKPVAKCGKHIKLRNGGRKKALFGDYAGASYSGIGNIGGALISGLGNIFSSRKLGNAYNKAGNILADAYSQIHGIDMSELNREDYEAPHTLAVVRSANTNINPQLERIRRNSIAERREINRGTLSSAARQQRLAATNDRMIQREGELYASKQNLDEQIKQANAERITQVAQENANRDVQARRDWGAHRMSLLQYNNSIENAKITGAAQARADALTQSAAINAQGLQSALGTFGSGLTAAASGFASAYNGLRNERNAVENIYMGLDTEGKVSFLVDTRDKYNNRDRALRLYNDLKNGNETERAYARRLNEAYNFAPLEIDDIIIPSYDNTIIYNSYYTA